MWMSVPTDHAQGAVVWLIPARLTNNTDRGVLVYSRAPNQSRMVVWKPHAQARFATTVQPRSIHGKEHRKHVRTLLSAAKGNFLP